MISIEPFIVHVKPEKQMLLLPECPNKVFGCQGAQQCRQHKTVATVIRSEHGSTFSKNKDLYRVRKYILTQKSTF